MWTLIIDVRGKREGRVYGYPLAIGFGLTEKACQPVYQFDFGQAELDPRRWYLLEIVVGEQC